VLGVTSGVTSRAGCPVPFGRGSAVPLFRGGGRVFAGFPRLASDLSGLDLLVIQIDGIHMDEDMTLVAAIGVDAKGDKHPLGLAEGATESAATVQALVENLIERGLNCSVPPSVAV
jgi:hypothetical protein